jgi:hypothetical protein
MGLNVPNVTPVSRTLGAVIVYVMIKRNHASTVKNVDDAGITEMIIVMIVIIATSLV